MYPQLATAVARRAMLLADLNTAEEGDGGAGLHAEALVAADVKIRAGGVVVPASPGQSAPGVTILSSSLLPSPSVFGDPSASTTARSNARHHGRNARITVASGAHRFVSVMTADNRRSGLAAFDLHDTALEHFLTSSHFAGRRFQT
jgi:hypothetical protein